MRLYYISRDRHGFKYRENSIHGWSRFDDSVTDARTIQAYFQRGNHDPVALSFTDESGKPTKIVEVKRTGKGKISVQINAGERSPVLSETDFIPHNEQIKYFVGKQSAEVNEEALKLQPYQAIEFYKQHADLETMDGLRDMLKEKMTDEGVTAILKEREGESEIYFIE